MPLSSKFRACDFTPLSWVNATGFARATAHVASTGTGTLVAAVDITTAVPNTHYDVRVIQTPRPSIGCAPGAPGVIVGSLQTDAVGAATTTLQGPIQSGATGAWVIVERPVGVLAEPGRVLHDDVRRVDLTSRRKDFGDFSPRGAPGTLKLEHVPLSPGGPS